MNVLAVYASKHGASREIAERIAATLVASGHSAVARPVADVDDVTLYDGVGVGGATSYGHWLKPLTRFVRRHAPALADRAVWLFSSGPLGTSPTDARARSIADELRSPATDAARHRC